MAAEQGARALVLENTFSKLTEAAAHQYPWLPVRLVMRNRYNSVRRISKYSGPLFQCHGTADDLVPIELGRELFEAAPGKFKRFYEVPFARHTDTLPSTYYAALAEFLDRADDDAETGLNYNRSVAPISLIAAETIRQAAIRTAKVQTS
jgi:fermentation-respiration switch protein FrsA (DUF1100 family)